jgi:RNA polymerase sigma-70 factor (ECF subfamily)
MEQLFRSTAPLVRRYAGRHVGPALADDVVSETFATVWQRWDRLPEAADEQRAWVFGIARLTMLAVARRNRGARRALGDGVLDERNGASDHADLVAGDDRVSHLLAALPAREREAMELTVWAGLSPAQAARVLGCTVTALSTRLARARKRLGALLEAETPAGQGVDHVR